MIGKIYRVLKSIVRNPKNAIEYFRYIKNDLFSALGFYRYKHRILYINGLPKSGTTWIETTLAQLPGYNLRNIYDPDNCTYDHNVCDDVFASLPNYGYSVLKLHVHYSESNIEVINNHVPKFVITIRDIRDFIVSRYFHIKNEPSHRFYEHFNKISEEEALLHSIDTFEEYYLQWYEGWEKIIKQEKDSVLLVKYEDLNTNTVETFSKILEFFELHKLVNSHLKKILEKNNAKKKVSLKAAVEKGSVFAQKSTFRKGIVGDWKNHFTEKVKVRLKEIAGDLLIELGYEKDKNW